MKNEELNNIKGKAFRQRIKQRVTVPNAATLLIGFDTEYISGIISTEEIRENYPLSFQLHDNKKGYFMPLNGKKLKLSDLTKTLMHIREENDPQSTHVCLCAWYAQAELSVIENDLDAVILHQGGAGNYGLRWVIKFSKRKKIIFTIYDLQALLGGSLAKAAELVNMKKQEWDHSLTTEESLLDRRFREYAINDAEICVKVAHELHKHFSLSWGMNPLELQSRGQLASAMFRHVYLNQTLMQPHPNVRAYALRAYRGSGDYGGCWQNGVFTASPGKVWAEFDAVSAYPTAAIQLQQLPRRGDWLPWSYEAFGNSFLQTGLYKAQIVWPDQRTRKTLMAIVPDGKKERFAYPVQAVDIWSGFELKAALDVGANVRIISGWYYEQGIEDFSLFHLACRKKRERAQKNGQLAIASLYKGLGNTVIGKLGQHRPQIGYSLAWDDDQGSSLFQTAGRQFASLGSVYMPEWWCLIVGRARAAMMKVIHEYQAAHAQVDAVLIEIPRHIEHINMDGFMFRRKEKGHVLRLVKRNSWCLQDMRGNVVRFAAGGGARDTPELRKVIAQWDGTADITHEYDDRRLVTLPEHAVHPEAMPLMAVQNIKRTYRLPKITPPK